MKETVVAMYVTITARDAVIVEEWLKCKREPDNENDRYIEGCNNRWPFATKIFKLAK